MDTESIESLAKRLAASLPEGVRALSHDLEENFQAVLRSALSRLDLVSREEFEVQKTVLNRTREQLAELEAALSQLEANKSD
ncbi:MAG: accessory factor UbiK family protein [Pseudomonadota bacterium]